MKRTGNNNKDKQAIKKQDRKSFFISIKKKMRKKFLFQICDVLQTRTIFFGIKKNKA